MSSVLSADELTTYGLFSNDVISLFMLPLYVRPFCHPSLSLEIGNLLLCPFSKASRFMFYFRGPQFRKVSYNVACEAL